MKRKYVYFIERTDTQEWMYIDHVPVNRSGLIHDSTIELHLKWTNDPFQARQFDSREQAEGEIKRGIKSFELKEFKDVLEITEHEFVSKPITDKE